MMNDDSMTVVSNIVLGSLLIIMRLHLHVGIFIVAMSAFVGIAQLVDASPTVTPTHYPTLAPISSSIISTFAGDGNNAYNGDGLAATAASFSNPAGVVVDSNNNVYFNDMWHHRLRKISSATGIITTYAGTGGYCCAGAGGLATSATLDTPNGLAIDSSGIHISLLRLLIIRIILN